MISPEHFYNGLKTAGFDFFAGVPDSLLSSFCAYVDDHSPASSHIITANEGNAIALAAGYHLSSGRYGVVYMQNSGLGNAVNPLTSLADEEVYRIPMLLLIGWRGEPEVKDEPQHIKQGRITPEQLDLLGIPYQIVDAAMNPDTILAQAKKQIESQQAPVALLIKKNAFSAYKTQRLPTAPTTLTREAALNVLLDLAADALVVSTTGKTSREVFELRAAKGQPQRDFLTVGAMGHTASLALGVAMGAPDKRVVCLDGDGSVLMHMGALAIIGTQAPRHFIHVLLNNGAHESVGGQPTVGHKVDFGAIAKATGYGFYAKASRLEEIHDHWPVLLQHEKPVLLEVVVGVGSRTDLGRPTSTPQENKQAFEKVARA